MSGNWRGFYEKGEKFTSAKSCSVWMNNEYIPYNSEYNWMKEVSSKSVKESMENVCTAFNRFCKGQSKFPKCKKKNRSDANIQWCGKKEKGE